MLIASLGPAPVRCLRTSNAQQGPALISGEVVNGTPGGEPHAGRLVVLHVLMEDGNQDFRSATTDANGAFNFADVPTAGVLGYLLVATHQGVDYTLEILPGEALTGLELEIFETTTRHRVHWNRFGQRDDCRLGCNSSERFPCSSLSNWRTTATGPLFPT